MATKVKVRFGQLVIGPPGSGKTTYCDGMAQFLRSLGRPVAVVNLDPANYGLPYKADIDISDLIRLEEVMEEFHLGPNGGLVYCMEFLSKNFEWLSDKIKSMLEEDKYLLIDCPGQVELYTHNDSMKTVATRLEKELSLRLSAVHLVDAHYCSDASKFISVCMTSLNAMLQMEMPHVNVLSKVDTLEKYGKLNFNIDYYTEVLDLEYLVDSMPDDPFFSSKFKKLNAAITDLVQNYSLVSFVPLSVDNKQRMMNVKNAVDKANGFLFGPEEERGMKQLLAYSGGSNFEYAKTADIREDIMGADDLVKKKGKREKIGNDLDDVEIGPEFQV